MKLLDHTCATPEANLACDEALLDAAESEVGGSCLRFWESSQLFVVVGYANHVSREVNVSFCQEHAIPVLRRCSGGGTVVQGAGCLNYALVLPIDARGPTRNISAANQFIMERNRAALERLTGQPIAIAGHTDLTMAGRKFSGNAQRRRHRFLLFHGTFLLHFDLSLIAAILNHPSLEPEYRERRAHGEFLVNLGQVAEKAKVALQGVWAATEGIAAVPEPRLRQLVTQKYATADWNLKFR